jgi:hypothetical protein
VGLPCASAPVESTAEAVPMAMAMRLKTETGDLFTVTLDPVCAPQGGAFARDLPAIGLTEAERG